MTLDDLTPHMIVEAARHVFRPDATEAELESDAPRILAIAFRSGLRVLTNPTFLDRFPDLFDHGATPHPGTALYWADRAHLVTRIEIDGERVL